MHASDLCTREMEVTRMRLFQGSARPLNGRHIQMCRRGQGAPISRILGSASLAGLGRSRARAARADGVHYIRSAGLADR